VTVHEIGEDYLLGVVRDEFDVEYVMMLGLATATDDQDVPYLRLHRIRK
jgi:hypothetical protein